MIMTKFKKGYNAKIVSLLLAVVFLLTSAVYGIDLPRKTHLRVPIGSQDTLSRIEDIEQHKNYEYVKMDEEKRRERARQHLMKLGADLDPVKLKPGKFYRLAPFRLISEPGEDTIESEYSYEAFEARLVGKIQKLAQTLQVNVAIHTIPSCDLLGITEEQFRGNAYIIIPQILKKEGIDKDPEEAKRFLDYFIETFGWRGTFGYGSKSRKIDQGSPSVPITLFVGFDIREKGLDVIIKELDNLYFLMKDISLFYVDQQSFENILYGLVQWHFEEINEQSPVILERMIAERYIDKLLEIAEKTSKPTDVGEPAVMLSQVKEVQRAL